MKQISIFKVLFFLVVVLPLAIFVLGVFIIPLVLILLLLSIFWSGKIFRFGTFRQKNGPSDGYWREEKREAANDCVDVESTVVKSSPVANDGEMSTEKNIAVLPENRKE